MVGYSTSLPSKCIVAQHTFQNSPTRYYRHTSTKMLVLIVTKRTIFLPSPVDNVYNPF